MRKTPKVFKFWVPKSSGMGSMFRPFIRKSEHDKIVRELNDEIEWLKRRLDQKEKLHSR